jgi:dihydropteroate synthase
MGVLNVTPDSFSDGGLYVSVDAALSRAREMVDEGAAIIDVGGESTRPGADPVPAGVEMDRVVPVIEQLARALADSDVRISVDTRHAEVAVAAVDAGASIVNDVGASLAELAADAGTGWIAMHMGGEPTTMQDDPVYDDVVEEVVDFLDDRARRARRAGVDEIWIDPGIGFGKTVGHNLELLASLDRVVGTGWPVAIGTSRKSTMGVLTARSDARVGTDHDQRTATSTDDRLEASLATATWAMANGVELVRAHDVRAHVHATLVVGGSIATAANNQKGN